jgi:hypothetical protein
LGHFTDLSFSKKQRQICRMVLTEPRYRIKFVI